MVPLSSQLLKLEIHILLSHSYLSLSNESPISVDLERVSPVNLAVLNPTTPPLIKALMISHRNHSINFPTVLPASILVLSSLSSTLTVSLPLLAENNQCPSSPGGRNPRHSAWHLFKVSLFLAQPISSVSFPTAQSGLSRKHLLFQPHAVYFILLNVCMLCSLCLD